MESRVSRDSVGRDQFGVRNIAVALGNMSLSIALILAMPLGSRAAEPPQAYIPEVTDISIIVGVRGEALVKDFSKDLPGVSFLPSYLPPGLTLDGSSGVLSGTPLAIGEWVFFLQVTAASGAQSMLRTAIRIGKPAAIAVQFPRDLIPTYETFRPFLDEVRQPIGIRHSSVDRLEFPEGLPDGVSYRASTGELRGEPSLPGLYQIRVDAYFGQQKKSDCVSLYAPDLPERVYTNPKNESFSEFIKGPAVSLTRAGESIFRSTDGSEWTEVLGVAPGTISYAGGYYFIGGTNLQRSSNGENWTTLDIDSRPEVYAVAYGAGAYVATALGRILRSPDSITWTPVEVGEVSPRVNSLVFEGGRFVLTSRDEIWSSSDGLTWETISPGHGADLIVVAGGGTLFAYSYNQLFSSTDGRSWKDISFALPSPIEVATLRYLNDRWIAVSGAGMLTSRNGLGISRDRDKSDTSTRCF